MLSTSRRIAITLAWYHGYYRGVIKGFSAYRPTENRWIRTAGLPPRNLKEPLQALQPDGILASISTRKQLQMYQRLGVPVVSVDNTFEHPVVPQVCADDLAVGRLAAEHFLGLGLRELAYFSESPSRCSKERLAGFRETAEAAGANVHAYPHVGEWLELWPTRDPAVLDWLGGLPQPVGVFAFDDFRGRYLTEACNSTGLRVPEDVAIVGVDDDEMLAEFSHPPMSSITLPLHRIGIEAARVLEALMAGEQPEQMTLTFAPTGVACRQSSDVVAVNDPLVAEAIRFIREQAHQPINVQTVLQAVPISRRSMEQAFRRVLGRTPLQEIQRVKHERLRQLLVDTDLPMPELARRCGFRSATVMSTFFREHEGITPSAYRRRLGPSKR